MMQMNWNVMVSSGNRKHVSRSMMIEAKNIIMKERTWINRVAQRERQRGVTNVKRSGEWLNMESKESVWCGSHVKRAMSRFDSRCVNLLKEFKTARPNVQEVRLKVNEFTDFDNQ